MPDSDVCATCKRPRYTAADLARWESEFPDGKPHPDPPWAAALCWTIRGQQCQCKPREQPAVS